MPFKTLAEKFELELPVKLQVEPARELELERPGNATVPDQ